MSMSMSIKYIRSYKIFGLSVFDLSLSFIFTITIFMLAWKSYYRDLDWSNFLLAGVLLTLPISIIFHVIFGVNTKLNYELGLSKKP
jgi:uncharacterized membrane protein